MNKQDIIQQYVYFIKAYLLDPSDFILGAGGAMVMHGLRKTTDDMDMTIPQNLFDELASTGRYKMSKFDDIDVIQWNTCIDLHKHTDDVDTCIINGVCCWTLQELLRFKLKLNRDKDQHDIMLLEKVIGEEGWDINTVFQKQDSVCINITRQEADWLEYYLPFLLSDKVHGHVIPIPEEEVVDVIKKILHQLTPLKAQCSTTSLTQTPLEATADPAKDLHVGDE
jgi:hypothetical protein